MDTGQSPGYCWGKQLSLPTQEHKQVHAATKEAAVDGFSCCTYSNGTILRVILPKQEPLLPLIQISLKENIVNISVPLSSSSSS